MVIPSVGTVVLVRFPFSDLSRSKLRPAVVLSDTGRSDWILCQITSQPYTDPLAVEVTNADLSSGSFRKDSYARPGKLFTANATIMTRQIGELKPEKLEEIIKVVIFVIRKQYCMTRHAEQINGREGETATFLSTSSFYIRRAWRRFRLAHLNRSAIYL